jgi:hypothetical protein
MGKWRVFMGSSRFGTSIIVNKGKTPAEAKRYAKEWLKKQGITDKLLDIVEKLNT